MHRRRGFTLIELLVVIAIIAILAAILLPVFARARENARRSTCQNNLKQIGMGIMQYTQDYDEMTPTVDYGGYRILIYPYTKSDAIFQCPSDSNSTYGYQIKVGGSYVSQGTRKNGYVGNNYFFGGGWSTSTNSIAKFQNPASMPIVADCRNGNAACNPASNPDQVTPYASPYGNNGNCRVEPRHLESMNALYADGHVKAAKAPIPAARWTDQ